MSDDSTDRPEGRARDGYGSGAIEALVRAVVPRGQTAATYHVLACAARGAVDITAVRADGMVHPDDVLAVLCKAIDSATNTESIYQRLADLGVTPLQAAQGVRAAMDERTTAATTQDLTGCTVRLASAKGEIERVVVRDHGEVISVASTEEVADAERDGREPRSAGFRKSDVIRTGT